MRSRLLVCISLVSPLMIPGCRAPDRQSRPASLPEQVLPHNVEVESAASPIQRVLVDALAQTAVTRRYDPSYVPLDFPMGDVPREGGVCTDVIIRAFRAGGVDLQKEVHEDMRRNFHAYPQEWGLQAPDCSIDHRRVPNLMTFFRRKGRSLPVSLDSDDYLLGDVVAWRLPGGRLHIGIVVESQPPRVVHNIGAGARSEAVLFAWKLIGHYRYFRA